MRNIQFLILFILCLNQYEIQSQDIHKSRPYKVWVKSLIDGKKQVGYLAALDESSIILLDKESLLPMPEIHIVHIDHIKFRRKGCIVRGAAIGAAVGFITGAITFLGEETGFYGDGPTIQVEPIEGGLEMAVNGAIIGGLIGMGKKKITIHGSSYYYQKKKEKMKQFLY